MATFAAGTIPTDDVLFAKDGRLGRIRLNRPRAINALNHTMITAMLHQLATWATDDEVTTVSIEGAGDKGLCAGGDVRAIRHGIVTGTADPRSFWTDEYRLTAAIAGYPKPFVAFMDGITMGGGVGVSAHGSIRLATERSRIAMPETAIGFFPDVGILHLLARADGELGTHLALTGLPVSGADGVACGLADTVVASADIPAIIAALAAGEGHDTTVGEVAPGELTTARRWIDHCYQGGDAAVIVARLRDHAEPAARAAAEVISSRSPLSVAVTLEAIRRAANLSLSEVLAQDVRLGESFAAHPDFIEGIRAVLVDRDNNPQWRDRSVADVDPTAVKAMFD